MQKLIVLVSILILLTFASPAQNKHIFNFDFEQTKDRVYPDGWLRMGSNLNFRLDSTEQHSGYFSMLLSPQNQDINSMGTILFPIEARYDAKELILDAFIKTEGVSGGFAGLVVKIDGAGATLHFDNMENNPVKGSNDWKKYTIRLSLPPDAETIYVGGCLTGKGKAWFDSFEVHLDGENIEKAVPIVPEAELDREFDTGSLISVKNITQLQRQNLFKLGRVWGFMKYYHVNVRQGKYNWDNELFRILPAILKANSVDHANKVLAHWVEKFAVPLPATAPTQADAKIKFKADLSWLSNSKDLGNKLNQLLLTIRDHERGKKNYYVTQVPGIGNPQFRHELTYDNMHYSDDGLKLLALFRFWNMVEYFFPYKHLIDKNWNDALYDYIPKVLKAHDELSYRLVLQNLVGEIQDSHATLYPDKILNEFWGLKYAPVELKYIDEKVVVTGLFKVDAGLSVGDVITHIKNTPVSQLISEKLEYSNGSHLVNQYRDVMRKLLRSNDRSLEIAGENSNGFFKKTIELFELESLKRTPEIQSHKLLDGNIGYIYPGTLKRGEIDSAMKQFSETKGIVVDLRCYPSDFIVFSLGKYLHAEPKPFVKFTIGSLTSPGSFAIADSAVVGIKTEKYYKGKIVVLVDENTISQSEYTTMSLQAATNAIVIGSTTAAADGNVSEIILPGNVRTRITGIGVYYPDGRETQRVGIVPDFKIKPTIEGIREGRDEMLEKAISFIGD